ncbi:transglycosylase SLT domain-containing protein [Lapillicoccus jejuensis]|uniref:NlpC/P60 family protein n=1 Tax=Lapillicoccus jejuensis TaxID=402171 RepID=A0A542E4A3_9MICO|nr:transglycosylase SLT domain-containing protein [Lapillicoccus jejuensis]TQJ10161.1 NlpC/P60 family protein [Lapillicoccus jejuensis]
MSLDDVTARMAQIQGQLSGLSTVTPTAAATAAGGAAFGQALGAAALADAGADSSSTAVSVDASAGTTGRASGAADAGTTSSAGSVGPTGDSVVADARRYLGVPYVWGGTDPKTGLDCSGLVQRVFHDLGVTLPRVAADQAREGTHVAGGLAQAKPGDLLTFGSPAHHIGIYVGDGKMLEAPRPGLSVRIAPVTPAPTDIRRVLPAGTGALPTGAGAVTGIAAAGATTYRPLFAAAGRTYGVSPALLEAVAKQESGFDPSAVSPVGARGLMQLMPTTARGLGVSDPMDPAQAVDGAARMLRGLLDRFGGRTDLALAAYNAGPGAVARYGGVPPYAETQQYVHRILADLGSAA